MWSVGGVGRRGIEGWRLSCLVFGVVFGVRRMNVGWISLWCIGVCGFLGCGDFEFLE